MKKSSKAAVTTLLAVLMLMALTACSYVFNADITGTLVDGTGNPLSNIEVYAYLSESARDAKYNSYKSGSGVFSDSSAPHGTTNAAGSFVVPTLRWESGNPSFGKDGDTNTVYFIFFSKDYGINKSEGYNLQSDATNPVTVNANWKRATKDNSVTVNFVESPSGLPLTGVSSISFDYTYDDGYQVITARGTTDGTTGSALLSLSYINTPVITISNITIPSGYTLKDRNTEYVINMATDNSIDIRVQNMTKNVILSFRDASTSQYSLVGSGISFNYSYTKSNGSKAEGTVTSAANGTATIPVEFTDTENPVVIEITNFESTDDEWSAINVKTSASVNYVPDADGLTGKITVEYGTKTTIAADVNLRRNFIILPAAGLNGHAVKGENFYTTVSSSGTTYTVIGEASDNSKKLTVKYINPITKAEVTLASPANTRKEPSSSTDYTPNDALNNGYFTGLAGGEKVYLSYEGDSVESTPVTLNICTNDTNGNYYWTFSVTNKTSSTEFSNMQLVKATNVTPASN